MEATVRYLRDTLGLKFYMLRVADDGSKHWTRVEAPGSMRVMMCVVKTATPGAPPHEYVRFFSKVALRPGSYILTLSDVVVLRSPLGTEPWPGLRGLAWKSASPPAPVFNGSGADGFMDIPIPDYDDVRFVLGLDTIQEEKILLDWDSKKPLAVFRGSATGCGITPRSNVRLRAAVVSRARPDLLDAELTAVSAKPRIDPLTGRLGRIDVSRFKVGKRMPFEEFSHYKYILNLPGNVAAYRLVKLFLLGSVVLHAETPYKLWYEHLLRPGVHYIPVAADLSDLEEKVDWCRANDARCRRIASNALRVARKVLEPEYMFSETAKIMRRGTSGSP